MVAHGRLTEPRITIKWLLAKRTSLRSPCFSRSLWYLNLNEISYSFCFLHNLFWGYLYVFENSYFFKLEQILLELFYSSDFDILDFSPSSSTSFFSCTGVSSLLRLVCPTRAEKGQIEKSAEDIFESLNVKKHTLILLPLRFWKTRKFWCGGARETHWATCHNRVTPSRSKEFLKCPCFFRC